MATDLSTLSDEELQRLVEAPQSAAPQAAPQEVESPLAAPQRRVSDMSDEELQGLVFPPAPVATPAAPAPVSAPVAPTAIAAAGRRPQDMSDEELQQAIGPQQPAVPAVPEPEAPPGQGVFGDAFSMAMRGLPGLRKDTATLMATVGGMDPREAFQRRREAEEWERQYPISAQTRRAQEEFKEVKSVPDWARFWWKNPSHILPMAAEQITRSGIPIGATMATGGALGAMTGPAAPIGIPAGLVAGSFVGVGMTEAVSSIENFLTKRGFDLKDQEQWVNAFSNPALMSEAMKYGAKRGIPIAFFDAATTFFGVKGGGKLIVGAGESLARSLSKTTAVASAKGEGKRTLLEVAANMGVDSAGAFTGEVAAGALADGKVSIPDALTESLLEFATGAPSAAVETLVARGGREERPQEGEISGSRLPSGTKSIKDLLSVEDRQVIEGEVGKEMAGPRRVAEPKSFEEAKAEGREWFGFVHPENMFVHRDPGVAERSMGDVDPRTGRLVAARADEVSMTPDEAVQLAKAGVPLAPSFKGDKSRGRVAWNTFLSAPSYTNYFAAVDAGVRVAPDQQSESAMLVDDTAEEVWGSEKVPGAREKIYVWKGAKEVQAATDVDLEAVSKDPDAFLMPTPELFQKVMHATQGHQMGELIFESRSPVADWKAKAKEIRGLGRAARLQLFESGEITVRPNFAFGMTGSGRPSGVVPALMIESRTLGVEGADIVARHAINRRRPVGATRNVPDIGFNISFKTSPEYSARSGESVTTYIPPNLDRDKMSAASAIGRAAHSLHKRFGLKRRLVLIFGNDVRMNEWHSALDPAHPVLRGIGSAFGGKFTTVGTDAIAIVVSTTANPTQMYTAFMHEMGHAVAFERFAAAPLRIQLRIFAAYRRWLAATDVTRERHVQNNRRRRMAGTEYLSTEWIMGIAGGDPEYWHSFEEWFAEQVARWGTTDSRPLGELGRWFKALAAEIQRLVRALRAMLKAETGLEESLRAEPEVEAWLNAMYDGNVAVEWGAAQEAGIAARTQASNAKYGVDAPRQAEGESLGMVISRFGGPALGPKRVGWLRAHIDQAIWDFKQRALGLQQLTFLHRDVVELRTFTEIVARMDLDAKRIMARAEEMLKGLRDVHGQSRGEMERFSKFTFDLINMKYLSPAERKRGIRRHPTPTELAKLQKGYRLTPETMKVYEQLKGTFEEVALRQEEAALIAAARRIKNPATLTKRIAQIKKQTQEVLKSPFFPMMQFGRYGVLVRDAAGEVEAFSSRETVREQEALLKEMRKMYPNHPEPTTVVLPEEVQQWQGLMPWFLDEVALLPGMAEKYGTWINMLRIEAAPHPSFRKLAFERKGTQGFSENLERVFAAYMFRHARNYARVKHSHGLGLQVTALRERAVSAPGRQGLLTNIANYMENTRRSILNPVKDWAGIRSAAAVWHLGFSVAAAAQNLMQTPTITLPFLAGKFGDAKATSALIRAVTQQKTFYKRSTIENSHDPTMKMVDYLVKKGKITENLAAAMANVASGGRVFGGSKVREKWLHFTDKAMWMFSMMEQLNRRAVAMATLELAQKNPGAKWLQTVRELHHLQFEDLKREGFSPAEATAMLAAETALDQTQYNASAWAQPRFVQGRKGALLMFFMYTQNTLFTLATNRDMWIRYALVMTVLAGPLGLVPDDIEDILNWIGRKALGRDFNIERAAREHLVELLGDSEVLGYKVQPDLLLHGISRYGFGIPALMDMIGVSWFPHMDRSKAITLNRVIPLAPTALLQPGADYERAVTESTQQVAGAAFGVGFSVLKSLMNNDLEWGDPKRWEGAMPRATRGVVRAFRLATQGGERLRNYSEVVPYDINDREHVAELIGMGLGYQPERQQKFWDRYRAKQEVNAYWDIQRGLLLDEAYRQKYYYKNKEAYKEAITQIKKFNKELPYKEKLISQETLERSAKSRLKSRSEVERGQVPGVPRSIEREMERLYPGAEVSRKRIP